MKNKNREGRTRRSLAGDDGAAASVRREIQNPQQCRGGERRRRRRWRGTPVGSSAGVQEGDGGGAFSLFLGPAVKCKGQESRGGRRHCGGGKKSKFTPTPYLYRRGQDRGGRGECSTTPTVSARDRHVAARSGAAVHVTMPLGHDGLQ
jgi:hypothetical protein